MGYQTLAKWDLNLGWPAALLPLFLFCFVFNQLLFILWTGSRCGFPCHRAHPGQQGPQDEETHLPRPRSHQPLHELSLPHRDDPHWEGADCPQTRRGGCSEEKGTVAPGPTVCSDELRDVLAWALFIFPARLNTQAAGQQQTCGHYLFI